MTCPRCRAAMQAERHLCHKQRKWRCPRCGRVRFQRLADRGRRQVRADRHSGDG